MMKRIARFDKVSKPQWMKDYKWTKAEDVYDEIALPTRATKGSAGYDFKSPISFTLNPNESITIPTGIRCEMKPGWVLMLYPRSGLGFKYGVYLSNTVGVIDSDYYCSDNEGHIFAKLCNGGDKDVTISAGDSFMQGVFVKYGITEDDNVSTTRNGGFGSTGR